MYPARRLPKRDRVELPLRNACTMVGHLVIAVGNSWIDQAGDRLRDGTWFADVGLPTLATLASIGCAVLLVKRQLNHDQTLRVADRNVSIVAALADLLVESGRRLADPTDSLIAGARWWLSDQWPDEPVFYAVFYRAVDRLGGENQLSQLEKVFKSTALTWIVSAHGIRSALEGDPSPAQFANVRLELMKPWGDRLIAFGLALSNWNGIGRFDPGFDPSQDLVLFDDDGFFHRVPIQVADAVRRRREIDDFLRGSKGPHDQEASPGL